MKYLKQGVNKFRKQILVCKHKALLCKTSNLKKQNDDFFELNLQNGTQYVTSTFEANTQLVLRVNL